LQQYRLNSPPRFLFEVDDPALAESAAERRRRLSRLKLFDSLAPFENMHLRVLDVPYVQPQLNGPFAVSEKQLLLCYVAPGLQTTLPKSEAIEILTWTYTELYGDDIFEEPQTRAAYKRHTDELLNSVVRKLPGQVRLLKYREIEQR
jgi:hypothetical protein